MRPDIKRNLSNKAIMLQHVFDARRAHKEWVNKATKLVYGMDGYKGQKVELNVDKSYIPLDSSHCEFGKWFENFAIHLASFDTIGKFIHRIEEHHNAVHKTYEKIYYIFFVKPEKRSILHKIITFNRQKVSELDKEKAKIHLEYMQKSSKELLAVLDILEEKIRSLDYNQLRIFLEK
jgi:hypothetical protein